MRWDAQRIGVEAERSLPGLETERIRTFDAPEALDTRFHEVRAKSALNKVPGSYLPFNWTVNSFRGCSHACTYCVSGDTMVLMADGRPRPISDLAVGDEIYGTARSGTYRRYVKTEVLAHWQSRREAFRITLEDGTQLTASGDHRFLSGRGNWKFVTGKEQGAGRRPHLTLNDKLMGFGLIDASRPPDTRDYREGYLSGIIRGDGTLGTYRYARPRGTGGGTVHRFRLALVDFEGLARTKRYLADLEVSTDEFLYTAATAEHREVRAIRTQKDAGVAAIRDAIAWPRHPSLDWCKGFLAGIFDAEGCHSGAYIRIANTDPEIIDWTTYCLRRLAFDCAFDRTKNPNGLVNVRINGGLRERLRFFQTVDPAITRKSSIAGTALKSNAKLGIVSIEALRTEMPMFDITTGTGDFFANGVVSHNCFARNTHTYLDMDAGRDFEREIVVKVNVPELLRAELKRPSWKRELVAFGTNTDPYQWAEGRYRLMPPMLEALREAETPASILTKSPLAMRDLDLFKALAEVAEVSVNFSVPTLEEKAWRETEPHTPHPMKRLEAVAKLNEAGIPSGVLIAPLMPGINDDPDQVEEIVAIAEEAGATFVNGIALHLRPGVKEVFMDWLRGSRPELAHRYERLYQNGAYAPKAEQQRVASLIRTIDGSSDPRFSRRERFARQRAERRKQAQREAELRRTRQTSLF